MTYQDTFVGGVAGGRDSDFNQGRRSVGLQIVKLVNMPVDTVNQMRQTHGRNTGTEQPR